jgi:hypothetical protein
MEHKGRPRNHGVGPLILPLLTLKNIRRMNDAQKQNNGNGRNLTIAFRRTKDNTIVFTLGKPEAVS